MNKTNQILQRSCPYTDNSCQGNASRYVFVCSAGMLRSATAAKVAIGMGYNARAVGSESYALIPLSANLIEWADKIFFVNKYNYLGARETFRRSTYTLELLEEKAEVWDIEDIYNYNDSVLVAKITELLS